MALTNVEYDMDIAEEDENEDEILQELFAAGKLKPGLNIPVPSKNYVNNVAKLKETLEKIKKDLPWIERLDLVNDLAALAPELSIEINEQEQFVKSGRSNPLAFNEFKRETLFHRQAQMAAIEAITRLRSLQVPTIRPDDYFAEMMKSDDHMQKVRRSLLQKQTGLERSEKIKKIRLEKKMAKQKQVASVLRKQKEKRNLNEEIKKYRKGARTDLDFLDSKLKKTSKLEKSKRKGSKEHNTKRRMKDEKYGFGGKTKIVKNKRPGKSRRNNLKNRHK